MTTQGTRERQKNIKDDGDAARSYRRQPLADGDEISTVQTRSPSEPTETMTSRDSYKASMSASNGSSSYIDHYTPNRRDYSSSDSDPPSRSCSENGSRSPSPLPGVLSAIERRLEHFTWAWFTMTMSTGSLANVLYELPLNFHGHKTIGTVFFIINLVLFVFNVSCISFRFFRYRWTFRASILHPTECLFVPALLLSIGTIITGAQTYGGDRTGLWFVVAMRVCFWTYVAVALAFTVGLHVIMWSTQTHTVDHMTPLWILPIYPLLLVGPMAAAVAPSQPKNQGFDILLAGLALQGIGFMIALMIYSAFISRLMTSKLPKSQSRPGMFISVGPSGFTISGLIKMSQAVAVAIPAEFLGDGKLMARVTQAIVLWFGVWLWGLASWFFLISVSANLGRVVIAGKEVEFTLGWWGFVFPNTAYVLATFAIGSALQSKAINIFGTVLTVLLVAVWLYVLGMTVRGVYLGEIAGGPRDEDRAEGGFNPQRQGLMRRFTSP